MAKLSVSQVKALRDHLGDELADFFADAHGVEGDEVPEDDDDESARL